MRTLKKYKFIFLLPGFCFAGMVAAAQSSLISATRFSVDPKMADRVKTFGERAPGVLKNSMTIKVWWDANSFFDQSLDCYTKSFIRNDTIYVTGYMQTELGYGFQLAIFKDSCIISSFALSDGNIYRYKKTGKDSVNFIVLKSITAKLVLLSKPLYREGDIVTGYVELKSIPFFYTMLNGTFRINLQAWFTTDAIKQNE